MKKAKILITSLLTIIACSTIVVGSTYALFTTSDETNIAITSGKVKLTASINSSLEVYSPKLINSSDGSIKDETNIASNGTFGNGGTAKIESDGTLTLDKMTPGDKATFKINFLNESNVNIKYKVSFTDVTSYSGSESYKLIDELVVKANETTIADKDVVVDWTDVAVGASISDVTVSVGLPTTTGNNYQDLSSSLRFSVEAVQSNVYTENAKKDANVTAPSTKLTELKYTGSELELINAGETNGGQWQYKLDDGEYSTTVPKATNAGTYTVYYKLVGGETYKDITEESVQVTIAKADYDMSNADWDYESAFTYDGSEKTVIVTGLPNGVTVNSYTGNTGTSKGNYIATVESFNYDTTNYNEPSIDDLNWSINGLAQTAPAAPTFASATSNSLTVNAITTTGYGDIEYAVNTTNTAPSNGWQTSTTFTDLTEGTSYYFFARYAGNNQYAEAVSNGANLGLGYSVTIKELTDYAYESNADNSLNVTFVNGDEDQVYFFEKIGTTQVTATIHYQEENSKRLVVSSAFTYTNVASLCRTDSYIQYYVGNNSAEIFTWDFGSGAFSLSADITITKVGIGQCIDENSLITMADGTLKAMKDIEVGDDVLSIDYETMTLVSRKVIYAAKDEPGYDTWTVASYYLHTFSDGTVIKRAMNHRFYCLEDQSYEYMHTWSNGEHTYKIDGTNPYLVNTEIIQEELHYCRITLEGSNNFFANGLATGDRNCCPNKVTLNKKLELAIED